MASLRGERCCAGLLRGEIPAAVPHVKVGVILHLQLNCSEGPVLRGVRRRVRHYVLRSKVLVDLSVSLVEVLFTAREEGPAAGFGSDLFESPGVNAILGGANADRVDDNLAAPGALDCLAHLYAARVVLAIGDQNDHAATRLASQQIR